MIKTLTYKVSEIEPYINWLYFFHAWEMSGKPDPKNKLRAEAETMLSSFEKIYHRAIFGIFDANSDGDDIIIGDTHTRCCANKILRQLMASVCRWLISCARVLGNQR